MKWGEICVCCCPICKSFNCYKKFTIPNVIYKGGGFYSTDKNDKDY
jgi:predicted nucleic acid-binding Zn ribbon protein